MTTKPKILASKTVASSRLFHIEAVDLQFSNGEQRQYERICGSAPGAVMIIPMLDQQRFLLVREYSVGVDDYVLGFPKGALESNEELLQTANRELMEEVGYGAYQLQHIGTFSTSPGYLTSTMHVVVATDLYPQKQLGDEPEPLEVIEWSLDRIDELLAHPQFHEARSIAALLLIERKYAVR